MTDDLRHGRKLLADAVLREVHDPRTQRLLHVWNTVLIDGSAHGQKTFVMVAEDWDFAKTPFFAVYGAENFDVYDGRELFG